MWGFWGAVAAKWAKPVRSDDTLIEHREPAVNWGRLLYFVIFFALLAAFRWVVTKLDVSIFPPH